MDVAHYPRSSRQARYANRAYPHLKLNLKTKDLNIKT